MCGLIVNKECNVQLSAVYKQLSVSQHTTNIKLSPVAYNSTEIPLSSIYPSLSLCLSLPFCLSVCLSLSLSLSLIAIVLNFAKKNIIVYLSMSLSIPMSASLNLFSLSFLHIPMAWN